MKFSVLASERAVIINARIWVLYGALASAAVVSAAPPAAQLLGAGGSTINPTGYIGKPENRNSVRSSPDLILPGNGITLPKSHGDNSPGMLVNTATGNLYLSFTDVAYPGVGFPFRFTRSYNSLDTYSGPLGTGWTHSYNVFLTFDSSGNVTVKEADGHQVIFGATEGGFISPNGDFDTLAQNGSTFVLTRRNQVKLNFSPAGQLTSIVDRNGNHQDLSYSSSGNLSSVADTSGRLFLFAYDASNHLTTITDPAGRVFSYAFGSGELVASMDPLGGVTSYDYTGGRLTTLITPGDIPILQVVYDATGRVTQWLDGNGLAVLFAFGLPSGATAITDRRGNVTLHFYDANFRLVQVTDALGGITKTAYDSNNERLSVTNPLGNTTFYTYDAFGNLTSMTDPLGNVTAYTYNATNDRLTTKVPKGYVTTSTYDANGNRLTTRDPLGDVTRYGYDSRGEVISTTDPNNHTTLFAYDINGNLTFTTDPRGNVTYYTYDAAANQLQITNANGNTTSYKYDALNRVTSVTDPLSHVTTYHYDPDSNLISRLDPNGNTTAYAYDNTERLTSVSAPALSVSYQYDGNGNRISVTDGAVNTTTYVYDALNRVTSITQPSFAPVPHLPPPPRTVFYAYDAAGNRTMLTYPDGKVIRYAYDADNHLIQVTDFLSNVTTYGYDKDGHSTSINYPNGTSVAALFDAADRPVTIRIITQSPTGPATTIFKYILDAAGNVLRATDALGRLNTYAYDAANELISATSPAGTTTYAYDGAGNRITVTAPGPDITNLTYDSDNRLLAANSTTFTYDANGNRISQSTAKFAISYVYDSRNRLIGVSNPFSFLETFVYDGDGNRVLETMGTDFIEWVNDLSGPLVLELQQLAKAGSISYVRGNDLISEYDSRANVTSFLYEDVLGSVVGLSNSAGVQIAQAVYDPWGGPALGVPPSVGVGGEFRFTGESIDAGTGLYYLRARYYDPQVGSFISRDPFPGHSQLPVSGNHYTYARNNPLRLTDHTGLDPDDPIFCQDGTLLFSLLTYADCPLPGFPNDPGLTAGR